MGKLKAYIKNRIKLLSAENDEEVGPGEQGKMGSSNVAISALSTCGQNDSPISKTLRR